MSIHATVFLADGYEEIEAVTAIDIFTRAGWVVRTIGIKSTSVTGSRGLKITAMEALDKNYIRDEVLYLPGGLHGAENLASSSLLAKILLDQKNEGKIIAAICASPALVLSPLGILDKRTAACYPGFEDKFKTETIHSTAPVVVDGNILTSRGPGTAMAFALRIIEELEGREKAAKLAEGLLFG